MMRNFGQTWSESREVCRDVEGAELIAVDNQEQQSAMEQIILNRSAMYYYYFIMRQQKVENAILFNWKG
jgi:hypothetical protein